MGRGRFPLKFTLLWIANLVLITAAWFLLDLRIPILLNQRDQAGALSGIAFVLALLESALIGKLKGES